MNQHEYVAGSYAYYAENYYEPGNPEDGIWEECHYPVPKCKGGTLTILLLQEHHAVQGVLQSEEYQYPCLYGWEKKHLPSEYLPLYKKWMKVKGKLGNELQTSKMKSKGGVACQEKRTAEEKRELAQHMLNVTPEEKKQACLKARDTNLEKNPNHYGDMARKARDSESQEVRSARGHAIPIDAKSKGRELTNSRKYRCTVTGHISTAGPLTIYQRVRNIDPKNREQVR